MRDIRTQLWVSLFVLVVFLAGLGAGVVVSPWLGFGPRPGLGRRPSAGPSPITDRLLDRLSIATDLTDAQKQRLEAVFEARRSRFRDVSRDMRERVDAEQGTFRRAIADILTPNQMEIFETEIVRLGDERRPRGRRFGPRPRRERGPPEP